MSLAAACPRCPAPVARTGPDAAWSCPEHGPVVPVWRTEQPSYDDFVDHLTLAGGFPSYLPWPLGPGWQVTDFAVVGDADRASATLTAVSGTSDLDGPVEVLIVAEEAGVGLGARCAGTLGQDPGPEFGAGPPTAKLRVAHQLVPLWPLSPWSDQPGASDGVGEWDRSVVVGETEGRWLWVVLRPASAMLLLRDEWILRDASALGPALVELSFGGPGAGW
ncbi:DUF6758 family protein [Nocardioides sp. DS6]|uniref:DUF6758 family protein n=1 Tax=Nocardioides eburneus TaxID=3231482 RepID=A0ABV3T2D4_9ACTN